VERVITQPQANPDLIQPVQQDITLGNVEPSPCAELGYDSVNLGFETRTVLLVARLACWEVKRRRRTNDICAGFRIGTRCVSCGAGLRSV
jgi:hypothetical protein